VARRQIVGAIFAALAASLALTSTLMLLHMPKQTEGSLALEKWAENSGFLTDATFHVVPVIPRAKAAQFWNTEVGERTRRKVLKAGAWFNKGASGKRNIFNGIETARPKILTPKTRKATGDHRGSRLNSPSWKHDCTDLINLGSRLGRDLGNEKVLVLLVEETWKCPFVGLAGFRSNWVIITGWKLRNGEFNYFTLIHELGHTLGLPHARKYQCTASVGIYDTLTPLSQCEISEYGDVLDPMGSTIDSMQPGFNAFNRYMIGWNDPPIIIDKPGKYKIRVPAASLGKEAYVEMPGGFIVSYRAPTGKENDIDEFLGRDPVMGKVAGVYLHRKASSKDDGSTYPILLPFRRLQPAGQIGDHFVSPESNAGFFISDIREGKWAEIVIHVGTNRSPVRDVWKPVPVLITRQDGFYEKYLHLQWDAHDPSGIREAYVVVNGKRAENSAVGSAVYLPYTESAQEVYFVAIDNEGNRVESERYVVSALKKE